MQSQARNGLILLSIGGVVGEIHLEGPPDFLAGLARRYGRFSVPPAPWVARNYAIEVALSHESPEAEGFAKGRPRVFADERRIAVQRHDFEVCLARLDGEGSVVWKGAGRCKADEVSFDVLLRVLWSVFLSREGGAMVHACCIRADNAALLFPGASGSGKSTLANKVANAEDVLSDELVPVRRAVDGRWRAYSSPFWGGARRGGRSLAGWPLRGIAPLSRGERLSLRPLHPAEATARVLETSLCFEDDRDAATHQLAVVSRLCSELPVFEMASALETPVDEILAELPLPSEASRPRWSRREMISEARSVLKRHGAYALSASGTSMTPHLGQGDVVFVVAARHESLVPGDLVIYWRPGRNPEGDHLVCHRLLARRLTVGGVRIVTKGDAVPEVESFLEGGEAELLGKVASIVRGPRSRPTGDRVGSWVGRARSFFGLPFRKGGHGRA